jgi:ABC-type oligopeptide transport system substrate-binding subunit
LQKSLDAPTSYGKLADYVLCSKRAADGLCEGLKKINDTSFDIRLKQPDFSFLERLNMNENAVRSRAADKEGKVVYSGVYRVGKASQNVLQLEVNPDHPRSVKVGYKKINIESTKLETKKISELIAAGH